jgi:hypothetical protein
MDVMGAFDEVGQSEDKIIASLNAQIGALGRSTWWKKALSGAIKEEANGIQRDLMSFSIRGDKSLNDNQAIALNARVAIAMDAAAAGVKASICYNGGDKTDLTSKYSQFLSKMAEFVRDMRF